MIKVETKIINEYIMPKDITNVGRGEIASCHGLIGVMPSHQCTGVDCRSCILSRENRQALIDFLQGRSR